MSDTTPVHNGFFAIHANHLEDLRRAVVFLSRQNPLPPLDKEVFLVQSNGIAQWLKLALAEKAGDDPAQGGLGIAAAMDFLFPARFVWQAYRAVLPKGDVPEQSPFDKNRLVWRLYRLLPQLVSSDPVFAPLARFLDGDDSDIRNFQLAGKVADLFDQYQVFRADWLALWEQGEDVLVDPRGETQPLDGDALWQPLLWRHLIADVGTAAGTSRSRIHTRFMEEGQRVSAPAQPQLLPKRIVVFGISSLPRQILEALHVLSRFSQVVLCVHNPSRFYWADIVSDRDLLRAAHRRGQRHPQLSGADPDTLHLQANPLLAGWGKQGRDYIRLLDEFDDPSLYRERLSIPEHKIDIFSPHGDPHEPQLLHQLQNDIFNLTPLSEVRAEERRVNPGTDRSLVLHCAHGPLREVEILHDQLLAAFNADPTLRPRDIMVMVPDINVYTPYIQAVFGRHTPQDARFIPFSISDQGRRHHDPLLIALESLLSLPTSRFSVSEILGLLDVPAIRARFGIADDELPQLRQWIEGANIRWGLHSEHRESLVLPAELERNTWRAGLRAMLLGYAMGPDSAWVEVEPYPEVGGLQARVIGCLAEFVARLERLWSALQTDRTPAAWAELFADLLDQFFADLSDADLQLVNRFRHQLERWLEDAHAAGLAEQPLPLQIVRDVVLDKLDETGLNQRFFAGSVNFATLMPMRAIPFRHVCLLGMNDGDYPRSLPPVDFDLMAQQYRPGDRSRREDDRYLFLEALLSARDRLYISWVGRSIRDDSSRPESVLVASLLGYIDKFWQVAEDDGRAPSAALTTLHPLQPFSRAYFPVRSSPQGDGLFTYEREWRSVHDERRAESQREPLPYLMPEQPLALGDLAQFLKHPVETFFKERLQVHFEEVAQAEVDVENFGLSGLERWRLDDELIRDVVLKSRDEADLESRLNECLACMGRRGDLGMGITEQVLRAELAENVPNLFERYQKVASDWPDLLEPVPFEYRHRSDFGVVEVADVISGLRSNTAGDAHCRVVVARSRLLAGSGGTKTVRYANLMADWVVHLAGQLNGRPFRTVILAKESDRNFVFAPLSAEEARRHFDAVLAAWMVATTRALPLHCGAAFAWIVSLYKSKHQGNRERAREQAEQVYQQSLEQDIGYLRAAWEAPALLVAENEFETLLEDLYVPLWRAEQQTEKGK